MSKRLLVVAGILLLALTAAVVTAWAREMESDMSGKDSGLTRMSIRAGGEDDRTTMREGLLQGLLSRADRAGRAAGSGQIGSPAENVNTNDNGDDDANDNRDDDNANDNDDDDNGNDNDDDNANDNDDDDNGNDNDDDGDGDDDHGDDGDDHDDDSDDSGDDDDGGDDDRGDDN